MNNLEAGKCTACGHTSWPRPLYCPEGCGATMRAQALDNRATVYATTLVSVPHPVFGSQYQVGYADLEAGPRIFGHFDELSPVEPGTVVSVGSREFSMFEDEAKCVTAVVFEPVTEGASS